jgi:hypothetical protein
MAQIRLKYLIGDADDDEYPLHLYTTQDNGLGLGDMQTLALAGWNKIRPVIRGSLAGVEAAQIIDFSGWTNQYFVDSDIEEQVLLTLGSANPRWNSFLTIPTINELLLTNSGAGKELDVTLAAVTAFYTMLTEGIYSGGLGVTDSHGVDITRVVKSIQRFNGGKAGR